MNDAQTHPSCPAVPPGTVAMIAASSLNGPLLRSVSAEFARRGEVHAVQQRSFDTPEGPIQAVRWSVSLDDSDDDFGTQLALSLLEEAADQLVADTVTTSVIPAKQREYETGMLIMDVDSTLIDQEVIDLLAAHAGRAEQVAEVTERAMRGELDFTQSLHERVQALAGLSTDVLEEVFAQVTPTTGAEELLSAATELSWPRFAVSGGFMQILTPLAQHLKLTDWDANTLQISNNQLTGEVTGEVVDRAAKRRRLLQWARQNQVPQGAVVAVGDGANDLDMLQAAGLGVAFCAKPALADAADLVISHRNISLIGFALGWAF